jgi:two-component system, response regulator RegA
MREPVVEDCRRRSVREWFLIVDPTAAGKALLDELRALAIRADLAGTGAAALTLLEAGEVRPNVIVLETRLPDGQGLKLLPKVRDMCPSSKLVIVTAYGAIASAVRALQLGAHDYLCKPVTAWALRESVSRDCKVVPAATEDRTPTPYPTLDRSIWEHINYVLTDAGTISGAARRMGLDRRSLRRMLQKRPPSR